MAHGLRPILERHEVENGPKTASADFRKAISESICCLRRHMLTRAMTRYVHDKGNQDGDHSHPNNTPSIPVRCSLRSQSLYDVEPSIHITQVDQITDHGSTHGD